MPSDESIAALRKEIEAEVARALEAAEAAKQKLADFELVEKLAAKHGITLIPPTKPAGNQIDDLTVTDLIDRYCNDTRSPFHKLRFVSRRNYQVFHRRLREEIGQSKISDLKKEDLDNLYARWIGAGKVAMAHSLATILRVLINFGATVLDNPECQRVSGIMHNMRLPDAPARRKIEPLTKAQVEAFIQAAHNKGWHSIALAQALQFELPLRQKDIIGEWVPQKEEGISDELDNDGMKWLRGLRWEEIDKDLILRHVTSWEQEEVKIDLRIKKLIMSELKRFGISKTGAIIKDEDTDRPYSPHKFRRRWRQIADELDLPKDIKNMDLYEKPQHQSSDHGVAAMK